MDNRAKRGQPSNTVVRKLIVCVMTKYKSKARQVKKKAPRNKPLLRRALVHSAQMLATPSVLSLQKLSASSPERVVVNVGGTRYEILKQNLVKFPHTLLGSDRKQNFYDEERLEYFFDRDHVIFKNIVEFYRTGCFHVSPSDCMEAVLEELKFFGIPKQYVSECCCEHIVFDDEEVKRMQPAGVTPHKDLSVSKPITAKEQLWEFLTNSKSSTSSAVFGYFFGVVVLLNISAIISETVPAYSGRSYLEVYPRVFFGLDSFCVGIFTVEYIARLYSASRRLDFIKEVSNAIDLLGIIPYYIDIFERLFKSRNTILDFFVTVFRMFRIFRVTKLARHSERFQNLLRSVQSAATELGGILFSFLALMVTFSSILYYFEAHEKGTKFVSIPEACWYTLVTMTTLGYGDIVPETVKGKLLGAVCALMGVLLLSLPVPIIEKKLMEFTSKSTPKRNDEIKKLTASLSSVARTSCSRHTEIRKKRTLVKLDSRTISMVVEAGSLDSITRSSSSSSSIGSTADHLTMNTNQWDSLTDGDMLRDKNGNGSVAEPIERLNHKRRHSNWDVSSGVGHGISTESPPTPQYLHDSCHFSSIDEDDADQTLSLGAFSAGDDGRYETMSLKELKRRWSYDGINVLQPAVRSYRSEGDMT